MRRATQQADLVRIDHFRGFEAYWSVPAEAKNARVGEWQTGPGDANIEGIHGRPLGESLEIALQLGIAAASMCWRSVATSS